MIEAKPGRQDGQSERKAAVAAYKERKPVIGIYAVRCAPIGRIWVGGSRSPEGQRNKLWFTLRLGNHPNRAVQSAFEAHGEQSFSFERLELAEEEDASTYARDAALKERIASWREELGAEAV